MRVLELMIAPAKSWRASAKKAAQVEFSPK